MYPIAIHHVEPEVQLYKCFSGPSIEKGQGHHRQCFLHSLLCCYSQVALLPKSTMLVSLKVVASSEYTGKENKLARPVRFQKNLCGILTFGIAQRLSKVPVSQDASMGTMPSSTLRP